jgi:hypothetical protein
MASVYQKGLPLIEDKLDPGQRVRLEALSLAANVARGQHPSEVLTVAYRFEDYINNGRTDALDFVMSQNDTKEYLVSAVQAWRHSKKGAENAGDEEAALQAGCYVDAFQSMHMSIFGECVEDAIPAT